MHMGSPVIGLVGKHIKNSEDKYAASSMIRDEVASAIIKFGATPIGIALPNQEHAMSSDPIKKVVSRYLTLCDGLIFQGGSYISPYECDLAWLAYCRNIPTLGFCAGQTIMVDAICPTAKVVGTDIATHQRPGVSDAHEIRVIPHTIFHNIVQTSWMTVNSRHLHSIAELSHPSLRISAFSPENHAEVIEDSEKLFYLATRFHPESDLDKPQMASIFQAFLNACRRHSASVT